MKCSLRHKVLLALVSLIPVVFITRNIIDKCITHSPVVYLRASIPWLHTEQDDQPQPHGYTTTDKTVVVPALVGDDMSWVTEELEDWQHAIYTVNPSPSDQSPDTLTTPMNKGHEAMAYLTYIIDHYDISIPSVVAFLHSHRNGFFRAWHTDTPLHDNVDALRHLQLDYVKQRGYVNLRCNWSPGCTSVDAANPHVNGRLWTEIFGNTSTPIFNDDPALPAAMQASPSLSSNDVFRSQRLNIWTTCCAQFAVSRDQIYRRPIDDYIKIRQWVIDTKLNDAKSGRVLEYLWHVIFGQEAVHCPDTKSCYCDVYGRC